MNDFIEKAMMFINENTMLLIGICIFLILVLIGYLIDNSIKTRKLEKEEMKKAFEEANKVPEVVPEVAETVKETAVEVAPVVEKKEIERAPEDLKAEIITEPVVETPVEPVVETPVEEPVVTQVEPVIETESMEDLLNKDFSKNAEVVNNLTDTQIIKPVENVAPVVTEVPAEPAIVETPTPVVETPVVEEKKSPYKSNSKLSDILAKKKENAKPKLETTQDFSDELDRILNKLNEETPKANESLDSEEEINNRF